MFLIDEHDDKPDQPKLITPELAIGYWRTPSLYGGKLRNEGLEAWKNIAFNVYDENDKLIGNYKGTIGDKKRWGAAKYIGPFEKGKNYKVDVDVKTLPPYYFSSLGYMDDRNFVNDYCQVEDFKTAIYDKSFTHEFAHFRFYMDMLSFSFAANEDVAKNQFNLDDSGKVVSRNDKYVEGKDYILKQISPEGNAPTLSAEEMEKLAKEGYRPDGFYFYVLNKNNEELEGVYDPTHPSFKPFRGRYEYLRRWSDKRGINTFNKFKTSSVYTFILDQSVPKVTFDLNFEDPENPDRKNEEIEIGYKKSLSENKIEGVEEAKKSLPELPVREGKVFAGWNSKSDGSGDEFDEKTIVTDDLKVYAVWVDPSEPSLSLEDKRVLKGDSSFKLTSAIKEAKDNKGNDLKDKVIIVDDGGFDVNKVGKYTVTYRLSIYTESVTKTAEITVYTKPSPKPDPNPGTNPDKDKNTGQDSNPDKDLNKGIKEIGGQNRQDVAAKVSRNYFAGARKVILVQDMAYADSMSAMNISKGKYPILYVGQDSLYDVTREEILRTGRDEIIVMGGENTISSRLFGEIQSLNNGKVTRVDGLDRFEVNKNSLKYFGDYNKVVVASGMIYTDALSSVPYAYQEKAPLLLVKKDSVPDVLNPAFRKAGSAVLAGGPNTVSEAGKASIEKELGKDVIRIDGADRYEVSAKMASMIKGAQSAILTSGEKWSDALTGGPLAQKLTAPILLSAKNTLPKVVNDYFKSNKKVKELIILGGPDSIGQGLRKTLNGIFK